MKKLITLLLVAISSYAAAQMVNQNTQFTKTAMFTGRPIVQDTALLIKSGSDTIRITLYGDTARLSTNAAGWKFSPPLNYLSFSEVFGQDLIWNYDTFGIAISGPGEDNEFTFTFGDLRRLGAADSCTLYIVSNVANINATRQIRLYSDYEVEMQTPRNKIRVLENTLLDISRDSAFLFGVDTLGMVSIGALDSTTIYSQNPADGTLSYCNNCSGNGVTGRVLAYIGAAWRRILFE